MLRPLIGALVKRQAVLVGLIVLVVFAVVAGGLPKGLPFQVIVAGGIDGGVAALTAMGLVLVYRASRIINFAQAGIGVFTATAVACLIHFGKLDFWLALAIGMVGAVGLGALIERTVIRRFAKAPRLILTVVTIGVAQLLSAMTILLLNLTGAVRKVGTIIPFSVPIGGHISIGTFLLSGPQWLALIVVPTAVVGLGWYLTRTDAGIATQASADSTERALLLGLPVNLLSMATWTIAALLSGIGAVLTAGIAGSQSTVPAGPETLVVPLAAAVIARFENLAVAVVASLGLGVLQQSVFWSYPQSSVVDLVTFGVVVVALVSRRRETTRSGGDEIGGFSALSEARPLPAAVARMKAVKRAKASTLLVGLGAATLLPVLMNNPELTFFAFVSIFVVVASSLVVLTGWGGQVSLGQFSFVGMGAGTTAWLMNSYHASTITCLLASTLMGITVALVIGVPALRIRGLYLAAVTLAFAVPASSYFLNSLHFPSFAPDQVDPPILFGRFDLSVPRDFYYFCFVVALAAVGAARHFRHSRIGRAAIATRDNERVSGALAISVTKVRLTTFAFAGALAGLAGGLYVLAYRGIPFGGFSPELSLQAFAMVVVGGMSSLWGAVLGALYVYLAQYYLGAAAQLAVTGGGILLVLLLAPGGLAQLSYSVRDAVLRAFLGDGNLLFARDDEIDQAEPETTNTREDMSGLLTGHDVHAGYGHLKILFGIDAHVQQGEILGLLGTNGAGKSTLLRAVAGLLPIQRGRIEFDGEDITHLSPADRVRRGVVLVPGGRGVFGSLTVADNLRLACWLARADKQDTAPIVARIHELFPPLAARADQKAANLSGGEQQMLTIAQALLCRPRLLMIDELSLGLAPAIVATLLAALRQLQADGISIVIVEQSVNIAAEICGRAYFLEKGTVRFSGPAAELADADRLARAVFLAPAARTRSRAQQPVVVEEQAAALQVTGVSRSYGGVRAVTEVDLTISAGSTVGVIGSNGAGKTTLFDIISGFVTPDRGRIRLEGTDVTDEGPAERAARGLGRTFQDLRLVPSMTVLEYLVLAHERHLDLRDPFASVVGLPSVFESEAAALDRADALVERFHLQRFSNSFISELSTGTRRVVELAGVVAHEPSVLILDEPSSGLAQAEGEAMIELIRDIRATTGATVALIEHDIPMIRALSDGVVCMHLGSVLAEGAPGEVLENPDVIAAYLGVDRIAVERSGRPRKRAARTRKAVNA